MSYDWWELVSLEYRVRFGLVALYRRYGFVCSVGHASGDGCRGSVWSTRRLDYLMRWVIMSE